MRYRRFSYSYTGIVSRIASPLHGSFWRSQIQASFAHPHWQPPADLYETPSALIIKVEVAGMADEDFEISLYDNALVIEGVRSWDMPEGDRQYHAVNIQYGSFCLDVPLRQTIDRDRVQARYDRGFLYITLPKAEVPL
jgi:HSP20 family molecular chaperone IbpA